MRTKDNVNKYGLSRTIPSDIKNQIRKDDGYGCVKCGNLFVEYEHIDPLFCDAKVHDPEKITLLCKSCHGDSTGKRLPKELIKKFKLNPYCKRKGFVKGEFYPDPENVEIYCGTSFFKDTKIIFEVNGKPLIWITKDKKNEYSPILYNAIFYDSEGNKIGYLNKNQFIGLVNTADIKNIASRVEVRAKPREINLEIDLEGYETIRINRINMKYLNTHIVIDSRGEIILDPNGANNRLINISCMHCRVAIGINSIPRMKTGLKTLDFYLMDKSKFDKVFNVFGESIGYLINNQFFDLKKNIVGYCRDNEAFNLGNEFIGNVKKNSNIGVEITMDKDEYSDQEPIWISDKNDLLNKLLVKPVYDVSYRLFNH